MWKPSPAPAGGLARPPPCGQLAAGTCEIVTLDRDSSQPRRTIARQTARCACRKGQIAGTTRARPACVDARIIRTKQWCDMLPCLEGEGCDLLINRSTRWASSDLVLGPDASLRLGRCWSRETEQLFFDFECFSGKGRNGRFDFVLIQLNYENKEKLL
ncbi:hypothetical protein MG293_002319 [Ovis ammon polii]|uniref:Protein FAM19A5 n=1 Tax=Ovis ammon polii TaxID=230172 RepID=A0AAD4UL30_OVIAM|nr:hypothetical protein MG293_002319 [Ovis ammon polii]KAI4576028.1 hypothetical protein MJT46_001863 [Ovis ammon polii x Ovis aries]